MEEIRRRIDCEFVQVYGMTETAGRGTFLPPEDHDAKGASAGKPFPGVSIAIRGENGADVAAGSIGEVWISSPSVMSGYWQRAEESAAALRDGWYRTGDVGHLDPDGYLFIIDRLNDKIVTGGENVYPAEVETALREHPAVRDAAVCGMPDVRWIEAIHAAVVLREGAGVSEVVLRDWVAGRIGRYKMPRRILFVDELPRNALGKVVRKDIAALLSATVQAA
jgi:long-chain acyl-CoA synthetase